MYEPFKNKPRKLDNLNARILARLLYDIIDCVRRATFAHKKYMHMTIFLFDD
jgi:hypothetical protein